MYSDANITLRTVVHKLWSIGRGPACRILVNPNFPIVQTNSPVPWSLVSKKKKFWVSRTLPLTPTISSVP